MKTTPVNKNGNKHGIIMVGELTDNQFTSLTQFAPKEFTPDNLLKWWEARGAKARFNNVPPSQHPFGKEADLTGFGKLCLESWRTGWKGGSI